MIIPKKVINAMKQFKDSAEYIVKHGDDIINESIENTFDIVYYDLDEKFASCIDKFYKSYNPEYYDRTYSLYKGYKIKRSKLGISWEWDAKYLPDGWHRADKEYIFDLTFMKGYHGGATKIAPEKVDKWGEHPSPGNPYYRTGKFFNEWGSLASTTIPIDLRLNKVITDYKKDKILQKNFDHEWPPVFYKYYKNSGILDIINRWR
jgi:hypothetical protein